MSAALRKPFVLIAALLALATSASAQIQNRIGASMDVFETYAKARLCPYEISNIATGDSLYRVGIRRDDPKAQILGLNVEFPALYMARRYKEMDECIYKIKDLYAANSELSDIYFTAIHAYCRFLLNIERDDDAQQEAREMARNAEQASDPFGLMASYRCLALIFDKRESPKKCIELSTKALSFCRAAKVSPLEDCAIHLDIADGYIDLGDFEMARYHISQATSNQDATTLLKVQYIYEMACLSLAEKNYEEFMRYYAEFSSLPHPEYSISTKNISRLTLSNLVLHGQLDRAVAIANQVPSNLGKHKVLSDIYSVAGRDREAYEEFREYFFLRDSLMTKLIDDDITNLDAELENARIQTEKELIIGRLQRRLITLVVIIFIILSSVLIYINVRERHTREEAEDAKWEIEKAKKLVEKSLKNTQDANEMKTRFIQNISHEIRTPLNAVAGFSQILSLGGLSDEEREEYGKIVSENTNMLVMLLDDIICISDVDKGNLKIKYKTTNCNDLCRIAIQTNDYRRGADVSVSFETDFTDSEQMTLDPMRVQQVLTNLLSNAFKNTTKGFVHLECRKDEEHRMIRFIVSDSGAGLPADMMDKIFERFVKVNEFSQGNGLGLNICRTIADALDGDIQIDKAYTNGARFIFTIPLKEA